jgi:hypothetical protein
MQFSIGGRQRECCRRLHAAGFGNGDVLGFEILSHHLPREQYAKYDSVKYETQFVWGCAGDLIWRAICKNPKQLNFLELFFAPKCSAPFSRGTQGHWSLTAPGCHGSVVRLLSKSYGIKPQKVPQTTTTFQLQRLDTIPRLIQTLPKRPGIAGAGWPYYCLGPRWCHGDAHKIRLFKWPRRYSSMWLILQNFMSFSRFVVYLLQPKQHWSLKWTGIGLLSKSHGIEPHHLQSLFSSCMWSTSPGAVERSGETFIIKWGLAFIGSARPVQGATGLNVL